MALDPYLILQGQGGIVPDWNRSRAQAITLAQAAQTLQQQRLAWQLQQRQMAQNAAAQKVITQAAVNGSGLGVPPTAPAGTVAITSPSSTAPASAPKLLIRPGTPAADAAPGSGGYIGDSATPAAATPPPDAASPPVPDAPQPADAGSPTEQESATQEDDLPDPGPVSVADAGAPEQPGLAQMAVDSLPAAYQLPTDTTDMAASNAPTSIASMADGAAKPSAVAAPSQAADVTAPTLTPYQQLAKKAGIDNPVLKENPYDLIERTKQQLLNSPDLGANAAAYASAYESDAIKHVEANAASKMARNVSFNKAELARHQTASDSFTNFFNSTGSEAQRAQAWPAWLAEQRQDGNLTKAETDQYQNYPGDDMAKQIATHWKGDIAVAKAVIDQQTAAHLQAQASQANAAAGLDTEKQTGEQQKNAEAVTSSDHAALSGAALNGLPALIKAYDALPAARRAQVAVNPHELDAGTYSPAAVSAHLAYAGLTAEEQRLANEATAKMAEYGSPAEMNRRAELGDPVAIRVRKSMNDQAIKLAVARGEAARAAMAGGTAGTPKPPPAGTVQ